MASEKTTHLDVKMQITTTKLNDTNYLLWARAMKVAICARKKWKYIVSDPPKDDKEFDEWDSENCEVMSWLWNDNKREYCNDFDLRKPLERHFLTGLRIDCFSMQGSPNLGTFRDHCATFLAQFARNESTVSCPSRIAIQSFCSPQCEYSDMEWDMLSFLRSLKSMIRSSNAVAFITFPPSLLSPSSCKRWQHMADTLLSVRAILDDDKEMAKLLTGYQDMVGLLNVQKVARINTQVPAILEATTYSIKLQKRRSLVLECLNQAPIDGSSGTSYGTSGSCSGSSKSGSLDF